MKIDSAPRVVITCDYSGAGRTGEVDRGSPPLTPSSDRAQPCGTTWPAAPDPRRWLSYSLLHSDVGDANHLRHFLGVGRDQPTERIRRAAKRRTTEIGELRLEGRIVERGVDRLVERFDGLGRRAARRAPAPGLFSMTNGRPSCSLSRCPIRRAVMSGAPPAP